MEHLELKYIISEIKVPCMSLTIIVKCASELGDQI